MLTHWYIYRYIYIYIFFFLCTRWKQIPCMWTSQLISLDIHLSGLKEKTQGVTFHRVPNTFLCGRCEYLGKGRCAPCHQQPFPYFLSHTGKENSHPWCCSPPPSQVLPTVPTHWFSLHYSLTRLVRKFPTTLAPFSLSLSPTLLGVRFNISWEKRSGQKRAFAFCHMSAANSSYHTRSHFCKLIFKSKSHRNLAGTGESPCPRQ